LEESTRPDIAYAIHQCARFMSNPRESHKQALLRIGRYLMATTEAGIIFKPKKRCDPDFCGNWRVESAYIDKSTTNQELVTS